MRPEIVQSPANPWNSTPCMVRRPYALHAAGATIGRSSGRVPAAPGSGHPRRAGRTCRRGTGAAAPTGSMIVSRIRPITIEWVKAGSIRSMRALEVGHGAEQAGRPGRGRHEAQPLGPQALVGPRAGAPERRPRAGPPRAGPTRTPSGTRGPRGSWSCGRRRRAATAGRPRRRRARSRSCPAVGPRRRGTSGCRRSWRADGRRGGTPRDRPDPGRHPRGAGGSPSSTVTASAGSARSAGFGVASGHRRPARPAGHAAKAPAGLGGRPSRSRGRTRRRSDAARRVAGLDVDPGPGELARQSGIEHGGRPDLGDDRPERVVAAGQAVPGQARPATTCREQAAVAVGAPASTGSSPQNASSSATSRSASRLEDGDRASLDPGVAPARAARTAVESASIRIRARRTLPRSRRDHQAGLEQPSQARGVACADQVGRARRARRG